MSDYNNPENYRLRVFRGSTNGGYNYYWELEFYRHHDSEYYNSGWDSSGANYYGVKPKGGHYFRWKAVHRGKKALKNLRKALDRANNPETDIIIELSEI